MAGHLSLHRDPSCALSPSVLRSLRTGFGRRSTRCAQRLSEPANGQSLSRTRCVASLNRVRLHSNVCCGELSTAGPHLTPRSRRRRWRKLKEQMKQDIGGRIRQPAKKLDCWSIARYSKSSRTIPTRSSPHSQRLSSGCAERKAETDASALLRTILLRFIT